MKALLLTVIFCFLPALARGDELTVAYFDHPPYSYAENGQAAGILVDLTRNILKEAGIPATFVSMPPNRILEKIRSGRKDFCAVGWFKTPERERYASFSLPIYRDRGMVILTTARKAPKLRRHSTLRSLFKDHSLTLGQVEALSLGESVDQLRKETRVPTLPVTTRQGVLLRLIALNRASYMLAAPEEVSALLQAADVPSEQFTILSMDGMPWGNLRYLMYSSNISPGMLDRINAAISNLVEIQSLLPEGR
ncbi:MAG: transporter substrate-binding domain-containing protein [Pseudomonadota bacterium]|nr:transporter substrate-binding domain-containing protein [Pseudomonadota bacterium]